MDTNSLLVELLVEELPPKALKKLGEAFGDGILNGLIKCYLKQRDPGGIQIFASPRRLGVLIPNVSAQAPDRTDAIKLMPVSVGLDANGNATPALLKRLNALGADESAIPQLRKAMDGKAEALFFDQTIQGASLATSLQLALEETLENLPIPKVMSYQLVDGWTSFNFVRPAHGLVALHGTEIVPIHLLGIAASDLTQGHRFEAAKHPVMIKEADSCEKQMLEEGAVIASFEKRRAEIERQLEAAADKEGLTPISDDALLDEVTALVERPNVLLGQFEKVYLEVPQECLILTMKANQKYFPLLDVSGRLTNKFLIVSNISPKDASAVIGGNERVVRPRLADAKFFFDQDRKKTLDSRVLGLAKVVYHNKLGSQGDRVERVQAIARAIGQQLGGDALALQADQAALLAKADLLTDMVGEFPELQGIMGGYYAKHDGLSDDIADAIEDHYKPRFAGDSLPRNQVGVCVALADKLEALFGMFGIGERPTGEKDPYALRRHALGIIRLLDENEADIDFLRLINLTTNQFKNVDSFVASEVQIAEFIEDRAIGHYSSFGYSKTEIESALKGEGSMRRIKTIRNRLSAIRNFSELPESPALAAANKRVGNILKKVEGKIQDKVITSLLKEPAEIALNKALTTVKPQADEAFERGDYTASLQALAALKTPVDTFFDDVMVNTDDKDLRNNRLALLAQLHTAMNRVADISKLA